MVKKRPYATCSRNSDCLPPSLRSPQTLIRLSRMVSPYREPKGSLVTLTVPACVSIGHLLTDRNLASLAGRIEVPTYARRSLTPAIVHIGVGRFHRAHQAVYLDDLAGRGNTEWGEIGVGLRSPATRDALGPQNCLFTVVERGGLEDRARVVGRDALWEPLRSMLAAAYRS
jgi:Mannitol dehydrogenase Rossmann domain